MVVGPWLQMWFASICRVYLKISKLNNQYHWVISTRAMSRCESFRVLSRGAERSGKLLGFRGP